MKRHPVPAEVLIQSALREVLALPACDEFNVAADLLLRARDAVGRAFDAPADDVLIGTPAPGRDREAA